MSLVDDILSEYSLTREIAEDYVDAIVRMNQKDTAEAAGVSKETIRKYKNKFKEMKATERAFLISKLMRERSQKEFVR
ncbi:hypothetical protein [Halorarum halobium]|uniref:hypothetical protein n=1 Tax=Halorarum halobium TaxID=3075121 RepID=UPI0028ADB5BE|nr:hypothetical protein [Halobaculum sp. XH14]